MSLITFVRNKGLALLLLVCSVTFQEAAAQVKIGDNPTTINPNSILELENTSKGLLLPRLNLVATNNPAPTNAFVQGMFIFNLSTNGTGSTAVSPGIYFCDGTQWVRVATTSQQSAFNVLKVEYTASQSQTNFTTPAAITDLNKISVYRNGVNINCTQVNATTISLEIDCVADDKIRIIQLQ